MNSSMAVLVCSLAIYYGTPMFIAALGCVLNERSGVLNLGVEGMMLLGAVGASFVSARFDAPAAVVLLAAVMFSMLLGAGGALIHAFAVITLRVNQTVSGLALTILAGASGLSSYLADVWDLRDPVPHQFGRLDVFGLKDLPIAGPILFNQTLLTYGSWLLCAGASFYLFRTRFGLHLRAVGESPQTADAMGISVVRYRYVHTLIGGALAGLAGSCFSLSILPNWSDGLTNGQGWIAIALVIFGFWRPGLTLAGAYLFGAIASLGGILQARGVDVAASALDVLPYLTTIVVLTIVSSGWSKRRVGAPAALGIPFDREAR